MRYFFIVNFNGFRVGISLWVNLKCRYQLSTENELAGTKNTEYSEYPAPSYVISAFLFQTLKGISLSKLNVCDVLGESDFWRCSYWLHPGRVGHDGHIQEKAVQRCDAGKYQSPGAPRWVPQHSRTCVDAHSVIHSISVRTASPYLTLISSLILSQISSEKSLNSLNLSEMNICLFILFYLACHSIRM